RDARGAQAPAAEVVIGPREHLPRTVGAPAAGSGPELRFLAEVKPVELGQGASEPDLSRHDIGQVERDKPAESVPVRRLDHEMSDRAGDGINDHPADLTAGPIRAARLGADRELRL